ncbi:hypothetical protein FACHB389_15185 [Nostoc calcicola FACHB-389]|nr:hypothetical protein FACHB389_15185 [Nostoc calcicola FACHB-389]
MIFIFVILHPFDSPDGVIFINLDTYYTLTFHGIWKTSLLFLSPTRRETLNLPPSLQGKGVRGLGFSLAFPHDVKSQIIPSCQSEYCLSNSCKGTAVLCPYERCGF